MLSARSWQRAMSACHRHLGSRPGGVCRNQILFGQQRALTRHLGRSKLSPHRLGPFS